MLRGLLRVGGDERMNKGRKNIGRGGKKHESELDGQRRRGEQSPHLTFHEYIKCTRQVFYEASYEII